MAETEAEEVVKVFDDKAIVQMKAGDHCQHCGARSVCSAIGEKVRQITIQNTIKASEGDRVTLSYRPKSRVASAAVVFILPIIFLIADYFVGQRDFGSESMGIVGSLIGLMVAFSILWIIDRVLRKSKRYLVNYCTNRIKVESSGVNKRPFITPI